ncbi:MAG: FMN-binding protein MioC [Gammaproteobacteria bacterium]|nr:FMN-binding protein MioC [Gammaproteobacteria bacterium]
MSNISIIIGTMLGASEYIGDHLETILTTDHQVSTTLDPDLNHYDLSNDQLWLICTSTHGAGDFPDNLVKFVEQLNQTSPNLSNIRFAVCGLGDTSYDTFCQAGITIDTLLESLGATRVYPLNKIDIIDGKLPEENAEQWLKLWSDKI